MRRYTLKYEFSTDGLTWIDFTDAVDSMQTKLNYSLCTQGFLSAKDSVNFTLPATSLPVKNQLINALMGQGDIYFRTKREGQNLDRARNQFALVRDMEKKMPRMREIVKKYI